MKKTTIFLIIIVVLVLLAVVGFFGYNLIVENGKKYEIAQVEEYNYFVLKQNNLYGVIDKTGNTIVEAKYDEIKIPNPEKDVFICYSRRKYNSSRCK